MSSHRLRASLEDSTVSRGPQARVYQMEFNTAAVTHLSRYSPLVLHINQVSTDTELRTLVHGCATLVLALQLCRIQEIPFPSPALMCGCCWE